METSNKISVKPLPYCFEYPIQTNTFTIEISVKLRKKSHKKHKMDFIFNASLKCCLLALRKKTPQTMDFFLLNFMNKSTKTQQRVQEKGVCSIKKLSTSCMYVCVSRLNVSKLSSDRHHSKFH